MKKAIKKWGCKKYPYFLNSSFFILKDENEILYIIYISYAIINISILLNSTNIRLNFGYIV